MLVESADIVLPTPTPMRGFRRKSRKHIGLCPVPAGLVNVAANMGAHGSIEMGRPVPYQRGRLSCIAEVVVTLTCLRREIVRRLRLHAAAVATFHLSMASARNWRLVLRVMR